MLLTWLDKNLFNIKLIDYTLKNNIYTCNFIYEPINKFFTWKKQRPFSVYFKRFGDLKRYAIKNKINIDLITKKQTLLVNKKEIKNKISNNLKQAYQNFKNDFSYKEFKGKLWFINLAKKQNTIKINNTIKKKEFKKDTSFTIDKKALWL
jgi:hypothetical protein